MKEGSKGRLLIRDDRTNLYYPINGGFDITADKSRLDSVNYRQQEKRENNFLSAFNPIAYDLELFFNWLGKTEKE